MPTPDPKRIARGNWWDKGWTVVEGCTPVSPGCDHCWAAGATSMRAKQTNPKIHARYDGLTDGKHFCGKIRLMHADLEKPFRVRKPTVLSIWNDLFHEDVPDEFIDKVFAVMALCPRHTFQVLTKRPARMADYLTTETRWCEFVLPQIDERQSPFQSPCRYLWPLPNVCPGTTVENQEMANERIPHLLKTPAAVRFLSAEPLLGHFVLPSLGFTGPQTIVDWVIIGCESGPNRRPCKLEWVKSLVDDCDAAGIPVFVKQLDINGRVSKDPTEWPERLRRREFPKRKESGS